MKFVIKMDKVKVCLTTQNCRVLELQIKSMKESGGILTIELNGKNSEISTLDDVIFIRNVCYEYDDNNVGISSYKTRILNIDNSNSNTKIEIEAPSNQSFNLTSLEEVDGYYRLTTLGNHYLFPQDWLTSGSTENLYYVNLVNGESGDVCTIDNVYLNDNSRTNNIIPLIEYPFNIENVVSYNMCNGDASYSSVTPNYYYVHSGLSLNEIYIKNIVCEKDKLYNTLFLPYNLFYYRDSEGNCKLWKDNFDYESKGSTLGRYTSIPKEKDYSEVIFAKDEMSIKIGFGLSQEIDYKHLYQEENVTNLFTEKVKDAVINDAPVIDMEKVKFAPYISEYNPEEGKIKEGSEISASALTFNLHFRVRKDLEESWQYDTTSIDYWNTVPNYLYMISDSKEVNSSDMLYYLGFTDIDVQNQKNKLKKSFLRLTFYDDTNPLTQKLLYYSTIFIDSGEIFGKYVKAKEELRKMNESTDNVVLSSSCLTENRLDCKFVIRDEYYTEKCSEGFNIYYFPNDIIESENMEKTIYMKIEFNHAGFGRTIPMITCGNPDGSGNIGSLSLKEYRRRLYIKLKLKYINGKYIYVIDEKNSCIKQNEDNNATIVFNLFEPILDAKDS